MRSPGPQIPRYLEQTYSWAYLHPMSLRVFEHAWVVNLILWGNMRRLTNAVLDEVGNETGQRALQLACVYGDFSTQLATRLAGLGSTLDLVDVAPIQLLNARDKLNGSGNVGFHHQDTSALEFADDGYDLTVLFFLLHEQPAEVRRQTLAQALRVTKPGGKLVVVDYHRPRRGNPMRYLMKPVLHWLEPFALDLWREPLEAFLPAGDRPEVLKTELFFGDLYQKIVMRK
jgi:ubiquinone/menaquinone biosynthesis C-methylase UbiE